MEILEFLLAGSESCGCLFELFAVGLDFGTAAKGVRTKRAFKEHREALARGDELPRRPSWFPFIALVVAAALCTLLVAFKWLRPHVH